MSLGIGIMGAVAAGSPGIVTLVAQRYWRLTITRWRHNNVDGNGAGTDVRITEWELYTSDDTVYPTVNMTGPTTPAPLVATQESVFNASFPGWKAFTGALDNNNRWISDILGGTKWLQIDLGSGNAILPTYAEIGTDSATSSGYHPLDFIIEGSATGAFAGEQQLFFTAVNITTGWSNDSFHSPRFDF